jgi:hypothetical protein
MALNKPVRRSLLSVLALSARVGRRNFSRTVSMWSRRARHQNAEQNLRKYIDAAWPALT